MIVTGSRGTYRQFGTLVAGEFTGDRNFLYFAAGIGAVGAIGYINALRTFSRLFLTLILIGIVVSNKGFFANLQAAIKAGPKAPDAVPTNGGSNNPISDVITDGIKNAFSGSGKSNPSGQGYISDKPLLDLGPLGNVNPQIVPGGTLDSISKWWNPEAK